MGSNHKTNYQKDIASRTKTRYVKGLVPRFISYARNSFIIWLARRRGAIIGKCVTMPYRLAKRVNKNFIVGDHCSIQTARIDMRAPVKIGNHVIIGADVEIITVSHEVDSVDWQQKYYGVEIEDYCWLATRALILPSCRKIELGAVCAAGSVVSNDVAKMNIVTGNPAKLLRFRKEIHTDLCVESMLGNDFLAYVNAYKSRA